MDISSRNKVKLEGGMSSMTDLVFLLLIFFIILSTQIDTSHKVKVNLPSGETVEPSDKTSITVSIKSDNTLYVNDTEVTPETLEATLQQMVGEDKTVKVNSDKEANFEQFALVLDVVKRNGFQLSVMMKPSR